MDPEHKLQCKHSRTHTHTHTLKKPTLLTQTTCSLKTTNLRAGRNAAANARLSANKYSICMAPCCDIYFVGLVDVFRPASEPVRSC